MSQIAYDNTTRLSNIGTPGTSVSGSFTVGSGNNRLLVVFVTYNAGSVSSVTYNGVAMTYSGLSAGNGSSTMVCYTLINPTSGSNTLTVTQSLSATIVVDVISYSEVQIYGAIGATTVQSNISGSSPAVSTVRTTSDKCWVIAWCRCSATATLSGSGFTSRQAANNIIMADSNGELDIGTLSTFTTTYSGGSTGHIMLCIKPAGGGGSMISLM